MVCRAIRLSLVLALSALPLVGCVVETGHPHYYRPPPPAVVIHP